MRTTAICPLASLPQERLRALSFGDGGSLSATLNDLVPSDPIVVTRENEHIVAWGTWAPSSQPEVTDCFGVFVDTAIRRQGVASGIIHTAAQYAQQHAFGFHMQAHVAALPFFQALVDRWHLTIPVRLDAAGFHSVRTTLEPEPTYWLGKAAGYSIIESERILLDHYVFRVQKCIFREGLIAVQGDRIREKKLHWFHVG